MLTPLRRMFLAAACLAAWLVLLFSGWALGGAIHLLLVVALLLFPWRLPAGSR